MTNIKAKIYISLLIILTISFFQMFIGSFLKIEPNNLNIFKTYSIFMLIWFLISISLSIAILILNSQIVNRNTISLLIGIFGIVSSILGIAAHSLMIDVVNNPQQFMGNISVAEALKVIPSAQLLLTVPLSALIGYDLKNIF